VPAVVGRARAPVLGRAAEGGLITQGRVAEKGRRAVAVGRASVCCSLIRVPELGKL
jgi:hypothetical protein